MAQPTTAAEVWRKSYDFDEAVFTEWLAGLPPVIDDPRYKDPGFTVPKSVATVWKIAQATESEIMRLMSHGPPYDPRMDLDGSFAISQLHTLYPADVVEWLKRIVMPDPQLTDDMVSGWAPRLDTGIALSNGDMFGHHQFALNDPGGRC